jgi:acylphosphatase
VVVIGRVQGVFFRAVCARRARELDVAGSIANRPDGAVEAVFEGSAEAVASMIEWCRRGPDHARVDGVEVSDEDPVDEEGFRILG